MASDQSSLFGILRSVTKTADYTASAADEIIYCDATSGAWTLIIPSASENTNKVFTAKKIDSTSNVITIVGKGLTTDQLTTNGYCVSYHSNGLTWVKINSISSIQTFTTTATSSGTTTLSAISSYYQVFTGTAVQDCVLPIASTMTLGYGFEIINNSTLRVNLKSSGGNDVHTIASGVSVKVICILTSGTGAASWQVIPFRNIISTAETSAGTALGTGVVILDYGTATDPAARITTGASWKYTALTNCTIKLSGSVRFTIAVRRMDLYIDGTQARVLNEVGVDVTVAISCSFNLNAGSYFDLRAAAGGASALFGDVKYNFLTIEEMPR